MESKASKEVILETIETLLELQLRSVRQLRGTTEARTPSTGAGRHRQRKRKSLVDLVVDILTSEEQPLHVDALVELLRQRYGRVTQRDALSSALSKQAGPDDRLQRVAPATFARRRPP